MMSNEAKPQAGEPVCKCRWPDFWQREKCSYCGLRAAVPVKQEPPQQEGQSKYPWVNRIRELQEEYEFVVKEKTFHSSFEDFLFTKLGRAEAALTQVREAIEEYQVVRPPFVYASPKAELLLDAAVAATQPEQIKIKGETEHGMGSK